MSSEFAVSKRSRRYRIIKSVYHEPPFPRMDTEWQFQRLFIKALIQLIFVWLIVIALWSVGWFLGFKPHFIGEKEDELFKEGMNLIPPCYVVWTMYYFSEHPHQYGEFAKISIIIFIVVLTLIKWHTAVYRLRLLFRKLWRMKDRKVSFVD